MKQIVKKIYSFILRIICPNCYKTIGTAAPITLKTLFFQKVLGFNRVAYWPMHFTSLVSGVKNIKIGMGTAPGLSPGCYIQGGGELHIDDYTIVAPNVGIITANHDLHDSKKHIQSKVIIGKYCWLGMNSVILPNVELGDYTIVGAGAVVTKSFKEGYCVIAGNPAKIIKKLDIEKCKEYKNENEYYGYVKKENFNTFRKKNLNV
jgi:acetyltransferase-like isoleucine patch superfamily enzyme